MGTGHRPRLQQRQSPPDPPSHAVRPAIGPASQRHRLLADPGHALGSRLSASAPGTRRPAPPRPFARHLARRGRGAPRRERPPRRRARKSGTVQRSHRRKTCHALPPRDDAGGRGRSCRHEHVRRHGSGFSPGATPTVSASRTYAERPVRCGDLRDGRQTVHRRHNHLHREGGVAHVEVLNVPPIRTRSMST